MYIFSPFLLQQINVQHGSSSRHLSRSLSKSQNHCAGFSYTGCSGLPDVQEDARLARMVLKSMLDVKYDFLSTTVWLSGIVA